MVLRIQAEIPERGIDVAFEVGDGETVALLGPNGAGKSTVISLLAGLVQPENGRAVLNGTVLFSLSNRKGVSLPAYRRGTSLLAQEALLFPHLSAEENVAFGPRSTGSFLTSRWETAAICSAVSRMASASVRLRSRVESRCFTECPR